MFVPLSVQDHLERAATVYGDRVGVVDEPDQPDSLGELTYARVQELAQAQAAALDDLGVGVGQRVAVVSHNAARLLVSFFGVCGSGRVLVPVNYRLNRAEVDYIVDHSGSDVVLLDPALEDSLGDVDAQHVLVFGRDDDRIFAEGVVARQWEPDEAATATINYTSGTTARPKGVQITHRNIWLNAATFGWHAGVDDRDVYLHTLPMFHANGWGMPFAVTGMGAQHVVLRAIDGTEILRRVHRHGVTLLCAAPAVLAAVLDAAATWDGEVPGRGRVRVITAGAPPPTRTIARVEEELGWELVQIYGLTETSPLLTLNRTRAEWDHLDPAERAEKLVRAGAPALGVRIRIDDDREVLARGNVVMEGYWDQPEETAAAIVDGWFHTGDAGELDDEHHLTIDDRKKDVIISGGENVSSIEVEDVLFAHPAVAETAVIGVPDDRWGETVKALVVLADGGEVTEQELVDHCRAHLAHYKCPTTVEFRDELERTATGKLQKFKLREPYWQGYDKRVH